MGRPIQTQKHHPVGHHHALKILILAESKLVRHSLRTILHHEHHTVHVTSTIPQAVSTFEGFKPDVVISDVIVPGRVDYQSGCVRDGLEFLELVKKQSPRTLAIIMSAIATTGITPPGSEDFVDATLSLTEHPHTEILRLLRVLSDRGAVLPPPKAEDLCH